MKITRRQLRQMIQEVNPGSMFTAAEKKSIENREEERKEFLRRSLQSTVDWFEGVVFPAIESNNWPISVDKYYMFYPDRLDGDVYIMRRQDIESIDDKVEAIAWTVGKRPRSPRLRGKIKRMMNLRDIYSEMERRVIENPQLGVLMQSERDDSILTTTPEIPRAPERDALTGAAPELGESQMKKSTNLTEARMVELTPINSPSHKEESLESKWMRIAGISEDSLNEGDVVTLDAFRPPPPGEEDSYSSEFSYGSADPDILHSRIVGDVYDDVVDQVLGKSDEERQQIFLRAIDSYVEQDDDVNMGLIDLAKVYEDLRDLVDKMEMRKISQLASERGTPEQEMEDKIEALMWQHGARPATVEEKIEMNKELLTKLIKEELALFLVMPDEELPGLEVEPPDSTDAFHPSEVVPREDAWSGGDNIEAPSGLGSTYFEEEEGLDPSISHCE